MNEKDCAFQFAKMSGGIFKDTKIVCDLSEITFDEAKGLWNKYYIDCAIHIKNGGTCEMVIWINMVDRNSYGDTSQYISTNAESNGINIWEIKKEFFNKYPDTPLTPTIHH